MKHYTTPLKSAAVAASVLGLCSVLSAQSSTVNPPASSQQYKQQANRPYSNPTSASTSAQTMGDRMQTAQQQGAHDPRGRNASELIGLNVIGRNGETLGRLSDFVVDAQSGKVIYGVISSGGAFGSGALRAVPFTALRPDASSGREQMRLDLDMAKWTQAPVFTKEQVASLSPDQRGREISQFYGQQPVQIQRQSGTSGIPGFQPLVLTSEIIGRQIRSGEQSVGEVENVIVQTQSGSAAALLDPNDDFAGTDQKYLVPFSKLLGARENAVNTALTRQDFSSARVSSDDSWTRGQGGGNALFVWPSYASIQQAGTQQVTSLDRSAQGALQQAPVEAIQQALQSDPSSANNQGIISIVASGDRVILSGTVQSEDVKERIGSRAEQAAQGWNIENQIRVAEVSE